MLSKLHVVAGGLRLLCDVAIEIVQFANPSDLRGIGLCLFFAAELQVAGSALEIKLCAVPLASDCFREVGHGLLVVLQFKVGQSAIVQRVDVLRLKLECLVIVGDCLFVLFRLIRHEAAIDQRLDIFWFDLQGLIEVRASFREIVF